MKKRCQWPDCTHRAKWRLVVRVPEVGWALHQTFPVVTFNTTVVLCDVHKQPEATRLLDKLPQYNNTRSKEHLPLLDFTAMRPLFYPFGSVQGGELVKHAKRLRPAGQSGPAMDPAR